MNNKIKKLLKSGNFTICYHDSDVFTVHEGKKTYDECSKDFDEDGEPVNCTDYLSHGEYGYANGLVIELAKILGGKVVSI